MTVAAATGLCLAAAAGVGARDLPAIKKQGTLRVLAVLEEREPEFLSLKPGGPPGFDREILQGFARSQGLRLDMVLVAAWPALVPALVEGKGDLIAGRVSDTPARRAHADFTREVFPTRVVLVNRKPRPPITALSEAARMRLGSIPGTSMVDAMKAAGLPTQKLVPLGAGTLSEALRSGKVEAAVWGLEGALLARRRDPALQIGPFVGPPESLAYGVRKGSPLLLRALNDHIALLRRTGTWTRLVVKYFGEAAPEILGTVRAKG